eukprot:c6114_g1_i1.p1 GENE.c6114_g1_i1~~c6114_g1_i1.p1  ORF type:complete len:293 (+),score=33.43 c6114_g1_i1:61-879(+)
MSQQLSETENAVVGMFSGIAEVTALQSLNFWKCSSQQSLPLSFNPRVVYRGYTPNLINMASCTMWQFAVCGWVKHHISGGTPHTLNLRQELTAGFVAGASSSVLVGPLELLMVQQQRKGGTMITRFREIAGPLLFRGSMVTAVREGLWVVGFLSLPPTIRSYLTTNHQNVFKTEDEARALAAVGAAFVSCFASHPFDTVKTCMQGDVEKKKFGSTVQTFKTLWAEGGLRAMFRGTGWRYSRQVLGIFILDKLRMELSPLFFPEKFRTITTPL